MLIDHQFHSNRAIQDASELWGELCSNFYHQLSMSSVTLSHISVLLTYENPLISSHGIAMPKALYFPAVIFSFFFFSTPNLWITERISSKLGHIIIHLWLLIWSELPRAFTPTVPYGLEGQKRFFVPTLNFDRTYLCNGTWYQQSERNLSIYRDSYMPLQFGELWSTNG